MRAVFLAEAEADVSAAAHWYRSQAGLGQAFLDAVADAVLKIERHPEAYTPPHGYRGRNDVRRLLLERFPYSIVFEILPDRLRVIAVAHVRRRPNFWRSRL